MSVKVRGVQGRSRRVRGGHGSLGESLEDQVTSGEIRVGQGSQGSPWEVIGHQGSLVRLRESTVGLKVSLKDRRGQEKSGVYSEKNKNKVYLNQV